MTHYLFNFFQNYKPGSTLHKRNGGRNVELSLSGHCLPKEIAMGIAEYVPLNDYIHLFLLNSSWNNLLNQDEYWQKRFIDDFSGDDERQELCLFHQSDKGKRGKTWKDLYGLRFKYESIHKKWQLPLYHPEFIKAMGNVLVLGAGNGIGTTTLFNAILNHRFDDRTNRNADQDIAVPNYQMGSSTLTMYYSDLPFSSHAVIDVILYLFDLSNPKSLEYILKTKSVEMSMKSWTNDCQVVLVGLKSDLKKDNALSYQAFDHCVQKGWTYWELSCKSRVDQVETLEHMCVFYVIEKIRQKMRC